VNTNILGEHTAFIFGIRFEAISPEKLVITYQTPCHHVPQDCSISVCHWPGTLKLLIFLELFTDEQRISFFFFEPDSSLLYSHKTNHRTKLWAIPIHFTSSQHISSVSILIFFSYECLSAKLVTMLPIFKPKYFMHFPTSGFVFTVPQLLLSLI
jgi:hypothetical protein